MTASAPPAFDVAVITPTFNRARLIGAAIDSVLQQTATCRIEMAIVDDGSTDETESVVEPYLRTCGDPAGNIHITYTRLDKVGVVTARNTALAQTTAPVVAFLDSDDFWQPGKLEHSLAALDEDADVGVVHTSFRYVTAEGKPADDGPQRLDNPCVGRCVLPLLAEDLVVFSTVVMRRGVIDRIADDEPHGLPFDPRWTNAQDYDLLLRAARACRFAYVPEPLTMYRLHGQHGAMGNLRRAFGFHSRVQLDFVARYGEELGLGEADARKIVADFLHHRAEALFWKRDLVTARALCELAAELEVADERFTLLEQKLARPRWLYRLKDAADRLRGRK